MSSSLNEDLGGTTRRSSSRRSFIAGAGAASLGGAFLAACGGSDGDGKATSAKATTSPSSGVVGEKKKVIWALAAIAPWNLPKDVGFIDATKALGWDYQKVGVPIAQYSPESVVNVIERATQAKPDVLVTPAWVPGVAAAAKKAQDKGILVMFNDSNNIPQQAEELGIPYVGGDEFGGGHAIGTTLYEALKEKGKKDGTIICGLGYPGNENLESRIKGAAAAIAELNKANGTSFRPERFVDSGAKGNGPARIAYAAKIREVGKDELAGILTITDLTAVIGAMKDAGYGPGDLAVGTWDLLPSTLTGIKQGWLVGSADKQDYSQGFLPVMLAWQKFNRGQDPRGYDATGAVITKDNIDEISAREERIQELGKEYGVRVA